MNLINVENITKTYTERKLFEHASFSLQEGEKVGVIGINGTGKTTLLKMLAGQEEPDEGTITTANHVAVSYTHLDVYKRQSLWDLPRQLGWRSSRS